MIIQDFQKLYTQDYNISRLFAMHQKWENNKVITIQNRKTSGLLYLSDSEALYRFREGEPMHIARGSVVFLPQGCSYQCSFLACKDALARCQLIEFALQDTAGTDFTLFDQVTVVGSDENPLLPALFRDAVALYNRPVYSPAAFKSSVYSLLAEISRLHLHRRMVSPGLSDIRPAIDCLESNEPPEGGIPALARMCHMSEVSFRKKFRAYAGMTPSAYLLEQKMVRARRLLRSGLYSVGQVAELLGYDDPSYFSKVFKKHAGLLPGAYARQH